MLTIITIVIAVVITAYFIRYGFYSDANYEKSKAEFSLRNVKYVPQVRNPFISILRKQRLELITDGLIKREGLIFGYYQFGRPTIMLADPELIQLVLSKEFTNFSNRRPFETSDPIFANNVAVVRDERWKRLRSIISPAFSTGKLRFMKPSIDETIKTLISNLETKLSQNNVVEFKDSIDTFTLDTIIRVAFGIQVDSLHEPNHPLVSNAKRMFESDIGIKRALTVSLIFNAPWLARLLDLRIENDSTEFFRKISLDIIEQKREEFIGANVKRKASSFLELMLEAEHEEKLLEKSSHSDTKTPAKYMTTEELIAQCVLFFLAGFSSVSATISMALYNLAHNLDIQNKLYEEIENVISKLQNESKTVESKDIYHLISYDSLGKFPYLQAVLEETLRHSGVGIAVERSASKDIILEKSDGSIRIDVKKGDIIHIPVYSLMHSESQYPQHEKFRPERFLTDEPTFHKYAYIPFGLGPRNCAARSLALLEAKLVLLHLVRQYDFCICSQTKVPPEFFNQFDQILLRKIELSVTRRISSR